MVLSPLQNLNDFFKNKPPIVIFLFCLVALAVSTFYFVFQIENQDLIEDIAKRQDWNEMLKHFNELDICINSSMWTNEINTLENEEKFKNTISIYTKVAIANISKLQLPLDIYGLLSLEGWYSTTCQEIVTQPNNVIIFFSIPSRPKITNGSMDVCVTIRGPARFLPFIKEPLCHPTDKSSGVKGLLSSKLPRNFEPSFCSKGDIVKLIFDTSAPKIENYISDDVRTQIYRHLLWCSYFIVFVIFAILLFFILKKSDYLDKKEQSARLL